MEKAQLTQAPLLSLQNLPLSHQVSLSGVMNGPEASQLCGSYCGMLAAATYLTCAHLCFLQMPRQAFSQVALPAPPGGHPGTAPFGV